jgi:hypothetical protein
VLVELGHCLLVGQPVEAGEEVRHRRCRLIAPLLALPQQIVDQDLRVHLLLDVERRRLDDQVGPVLLVLAAPDELRVQVAVAPLIGQPDRVLSRSSMTGSSSAVGMLRRLSLWRSASMSMVLLAMCCSSFSESVREL